jgi:hypothetical protein
MKMLSLTINQYEFLAIRIGKSFKRITLPNIKRERGTGILKHLTYIL